MFDKDKMSVCYHDATFLIGYRTWCPNSSKCFWDVAVEIIEIFIRLLFIRFNMYWVRHYLMLNIVRVSLLILLSKIIWLKVENKLMISKIGRIKSQYEETDRKATFAALFLIKRLKLTT